MQVLELIGQVLATMFAGVFLRLAVPVGITMLLVLWLRWLDTRWQKEAEQYHHEMAGPRQTGLPIPCWSILGCSEAKREKCPAYQDQEQPCWQVFRGADGQLKQACLGCEVFREAPVAVAV
jgi:hypothetical protein